MSFNISQFPWKTPLAENWHDQVKQLNRQLSIIQNHKDTSEATVTGEVGILLRRMANNRLDMLTQIQFQKATSDLWPIKEKLGHIRPLKLGIVGNRTLTYLLEPLRVAGLSRGLLIATVEAPYNSATALAMGQIRPFENAALDAVLLFLDESAFVNQRSLLDEGQATIAVEKSIEMLDAITEGLGKQTNAPIIVPTMPLRPELAVSATDAFMAGASANLISKINAHILQGAQTSQWLVWDVAHLAAQVGLNAWFDPVRYYQAKTPFAIELSLLAADHLCRLLAAMTGKSARALILDLDNTLWGGVIGDDGVEGIVIGQGSPEGEVFVAFQELILELRQRGVVLAVCSKNQNEIARKPFRQHPDMLLREEHIAVFQANWQDKATNIKAIAETLNLSQESFVFVDDNPAERARVRQELPLVHVPEMGDNPAYYPHILTAGGYFEHLPLNADDLSRAASYQSNAKRAEIRVKVGNYEDYLKSLAMEMSIACFDAIGRTRIIQLVNKSNQFNLTTRRYNSEQITELENNPDIIGWQVRLSDMFGKHGMICVVIVNKQPESWHIDSWLMSCRVLERGVEQAIMNELVKLAQASGISHISGEYIATERNGMVADFYQKMNFDPVQSNGNDTQQYRLCLTDFEPFNVYMNIEYAHLS